MELHSVWDGERKKGKPMTQCSSEPIFASSQHMFKHIYNIIAPMFLLSKHWKQSLYSNSLYYVSVEQRILNKSNEIQTEELLLP